MRWWTPVGPSVGRSVGWSVRPYRRGCNILFAFVPNKLNYRFTPRPVPPRNTCRTFSLTPLLALWVTYTVKTEWLLFEFLLRLCMAVVRISSPLYRRFKASCSDFTYTVKVSFAARFARSCNTSREGGKRMGAISGSNLGIPVRNRKRMQGGNVGGWSCAV